MWRPSRGRMGGCFRGLLHQHVCSNVIARSGNTKKTQPVLEQASKPVTGAHGGVVHGAMEWRWAGGLDSMASVNFSTFK